MIAKAAIKIILVGVSLSVIMILSLAFFMNITEYLGFDISLAISLISTLSVVLVLFYILMSKLFVKESIAYWKNQKIKLDSSLLEGTITEKQYSIKLEPINKALGYFNE